MMVCALSGLSDRRTFLHGAAATVGLMLIALIGLLIGLSVNFRLPNLLLAAGYVVSTCRRVPDGAKPGTPSCKAHAFGIAFWSGWRRR